MFCVCMLDDINKQFPDGREEDDPNFITDRFGGIVILKFTADGVLLFELFGQSFHGRLQAEIIQDRRT